MSGFSANESPAVILIVDDEEPARRLASIALGRAGFATVVAADASEALALLAQEPFDAVVLDLRLPGMNGLELLSVLRARRSTATLPVVMVTGESGIEAAVSGFAAGATDYVAKPYHPDELVARVRAHLRSQAAWFTRLDRDWHDRSASASALASLGRGDSPRETARRVCEHLAAIPHIGGAAVLGLDDPGRAVLLAEAGGTAWRDTVGALLQLPPDYLIAHARRAWIELPDAGQLTTAIPVAVAPIRHGDVTAGLLVVGGRNGAIGHADSLLAETIDYATVVTGLLGHDLHDHTERELLYDELSLVVAHHAYAPVFQPLVSLDERDVLGYEALTRFSDGRSPEQRFADAESLGVGADLELATLAAAVADARHLPEGAFLSVNVSPRLVVECATELESALTAVERPIVLELTEHDAVSDYVELRSTLDAFNRPVRLSVDDAGAGFASLRHVLMLEPDFVKLDRSWVSGIDQDKARQALVAGLAHFARMTGCELVAEGIETETELSALAGLDVAIGQGYLLGAPAPVLSPS